MPGVEADVREARAAYQRRDWERVVAILDSRDDPQAHDLLASAHRQRGEFDAALRHREAAVHGYRAAGEAVAAARSATWLGQDRAFLRNELAIARAWFDRAEQLLADVATCQEHGLLAFARGQVEMLLGDDPVRGREGGSRAREVARTLGSDELESLGLALEGLASVRSGEVEAGLVLLDRATAVAITGPPSASRYAGTVSCALLDACERVQDVARATQWVETLTEWERENPNVELFAFCRMHYSWVLAASGRIAEAERELATALDAFERGAPAMRFEGALRLAMLRLIQGREEEVEALCREVDWHPRTLLCRAQLALFRGELEDAASLLAQYRRGCDLALELCDACGLELGVRIALARGAIADAAADVDRLAQLAVLIDTPGLRGTAALGAGLLAAATDRAGEAEERLEDALRLFLAARAPIEAAKARIELGRLLARAGRADRAARELDAAREVLSAAGADGLVRALGASSPIAPSGPTVLSARELDVLRLAAAGHHDAAIAASLVLSEHTVHRHMANIRRKLGQRTRAAAVARAARDGLI